MRTVGAGALSCVVDCRKITVRRPVGYDGCIRELREDRMQCRFPRNSMTNTSST